MTRSQVRWEEIPEFPDYLVSSEGQVSNMRRGGTDIMPRPNQYGHIRVGLVKDGRQYTRGLSNIVAEVFHGLPENHYWDTVIHLDGDLYNCRAENLMWRPRWFAIAFHRQWQREDIHKDHGAIQDFFTGDVYPSPRVAVMTLGILYKDILLSFHNDYYTFPTQQKWRPVRE